MRPAAVCVDVGSTWTKLCAVAVDDGTLLATSARLTTVDSDVLDGLDAGLEELHARLPGTDLSDVRVCSSAGGGLRLAVVGHERAITAEAGARVGLSAGARLIHVSGGPVDIGGLLRDRPDVILLVGGTDGGNDESLRTNARRLAESTVDVPIVVAGNIEARAEVCQLLTQKRVVATANVLPRIGVLEPRPARAAIRDVFIRHVIGGKRLSTGDRFAALVRGATPDLVLAGVELLADGSGSIRGAGDVVVVDVGGATTDVYSVLTPDPEEATLHREAVEAMPRSRTVEGDLGVRWSAPALLEAAQGERLLDAAEVQALSEPANARQAAPGAVPLTPADREIDARLAELAVTIALRRHARAGVTGDGVRIPGRDLRQVNLVVASGGVVRHASTADQHRILAPARADLAGGWQTAERARLAVDVDYVLAAAGLLAEDHPTAGAALLRRHLSTDPA